MANILIIVTGSIAAIKIPDLVSNLKKQGHNITCCLTKSAKHFVNEDSLSYISGNKVHTEMFAADDESKMAHISLSRENDLILVAPASADFMAKMAYGFCDDLASTICLASDKDILVAPAMNVEMYNKPATKRNIKTLKGDGIFIIEPEKGKLACGEEGMGRMANIERILSVLDSKLQDIGKNKINLSGLKCLVTSGPTRENIDPVRYISNYSSGKQGHSIAEALAKYGAEVTLVSGPTTIDISDSVNLIEVESASDMLSACRDILPVDVAICAAAVADWKPESESGQKIKKQEENTTQMLKLIENPDILYDISHSGKKRPKLVIGFAAETEHLIENAMVKLERKGCDWIVANNVGEDEVFNSEENTVHIISSAGVIETITKKRKSDIAKRLCVLISENFKNSNVSVFKTN